MIGKIALFILLFAVTVLVAPTRAEAQGDPVVTVTMQLSWRHQFQFAGYYAALERGFYKNAGLDVTLLEGGPGVICDHNQLKSVNFCNATGSIVKLRAEGQPVVVMASIIQHSPVVLITKKSTGIYTPHDLSGKRVELLINGQPSPEIKAMLHKEGVRLDHLNISENTHGIDALINDEVDAIYAYFSNEPLQLREASVEFNVIQPRHYGVDFYGDSLITSQAYLAQFPLHAERFRRATLQGWRYAMSHQGEMADLIRNKYSQEKSRGSLLAEARVIHDLMYPGIIEIGHINPGRWWSNADTLVTAGIIDAGYTLDGFFYDPHHKKDYLHVIRLLALGLSLMALVMALLWLFNQRLTREVAERKQAQERLRRAKEDSDRMAYTDELSGLGNRRAFYNQGKDAIKLARELHTDLSLVLMDIDHFKSINDTFGHLVGDQVIRQVGAEILQAVRFSDIHGRIGGEEFAILLPNTELQGAMELAERLRLAIEHMPVQHNDEEMYCTASFGVALLQADEDDINQLVKRADDALYTAKGLGRNCVQSG